MVPPPDFLCAVTQTLSYDDTSNTHILTGAPPYIIITKIDSLLTNQCELKEQVNEALQIDIDEQNIVGGYNTIWMMGFFKEFMDRVIKLIDWLNNNRDGRGGGLY